MKDVKITGEITFDGFRDGATASVFSKAFSIDAVIPDEGTTADVDRAFRLAFSNEPERLFVFEQIARERGRQDEKHGDKSARHATGGLLALILTEEVGEVCRAILERDEASEYDELVHVAAVAVARLEAMTIAQRSRRRQGKTAAPA